VNKVAPFPFPSLSSVRAALIPTQKHHNATAKNVELCPLILYKMITFLDKSLAGKTSLFFLLLMIGFSDLVCIVDFLCCHCHE